MKVLKGILFLLLLTSHLQANSLQTLPPYHWVYDSLDELRLRGYFFELFTMNKPFTRGQVATALETLLQEINEGKIRPNLADQWRIYHLVKEFTDILQHSNLYNLNAGLMISETAGISDGESEINGRWRTKFSYSPSANVELFNAIYFNQSDFDDPLYIGERWRGFTLLTEQAFARIKLGNWHLLLGRDFLKWGPGKDAGLLISDYSRPLDQISARYSHRFFRFTSVVATLDAMSVNSAKYYASKAYRYLTAHRLDLKINRKLQIGYSEAALYGGPDARLEFNYLNPFLPLYGEIVNLNGSAGNILGTVDFQYFPICGLELYGEFLLDDIQVEKTGPGDLEPNELGMICGFQLADPLLFTGITIGAEYTVVTNRTYNTVSPWEKFIHRNQPIGHFLGNDFTRLRLHGKYWLSGKIQVAANYENVHAGEGDVLNDFDTPWMDYTVAQGYSEPFPTGTVETTNFFNLKLIYQPWHQWHFSLESAYTNIRNFENIEGQNKNFMGFFLNIWLDWEYFNKL